MKTIFIILISILSLHCEYTDHDFSHKQVRIWKNGVIPYVYHENLSAYQKQQIEIAMKVWMDRSNIAFRPAVNDDIVIVTISKSTRNNATVGSCVWARMELCTFFQSTIIHELGHVIGLKHEHQRPDREQYVNIYWENIKDYAKYNFEIETESNYLYDLRIFEYDYYSIMHYGNYVFSKNGEITISKKNGEPVYYNNSPSDVDYAKVNYMYSAN